MDDRILTYFTGELNSSERLELLKCIEADELLKLEFVRVQNIRALSYLSRLANNESEGRRSFRNFIRRCRSKRQHETTYTLLQYAAVAVALIVSTFFVTRHFFGNVENLENDINTLYVPAGQRAQITLQDGTKVWLNAQSTLTYPSHFSKKKRNVEIVGEAFFDVAGDKKKPFIVSTRNIDMKVLGTQFNVYSYPDAGWIRTSLVEGSLRIYKSGNENRAVTLKPNEQVTIQGNKMTVRTIVHPDHLLWKEGIYAFQNERLIDILEKLQLYYDVKIIVKDPEIFNVRYTGKFRQRDGIDEILRIIQKIRKFNIEKDTETNTITLTR